MPNFRKLTKLAAALALALSLSGPVGAGLLSEVLAAGMFDGALLGVVASARQRKKSSSHTKAKSSRSTKRRSGSKASRSRQHRVARQPAKPKYAYPLDFFMMRAPDYDRSPYDEATAAKVKNAFNCGLADDYSPQQLIKAGVFRFHALSGGIFKRREPVKYIVLHSTETGIPVPAINVINSWSSGGRRHPGAQFVVERDGTIYQCVDPEYATVHVNIFKTLPGINNDNTVGIEMNHTGRQDYPHAQTAATLKLVHYLQSRFSVDSTNVITHRYAQQGDHTDPVNFDLTAFLGNKENFRNRALAMRRNQPPSVLDEESEPETPLASVYVQIHGTLKVPPKTEPAKSEAPKAVAPRVYDPGKNNPPKAGLTQLRGELPLDPSALTAIRSRSIH